MKTLLINKGEKKELVRHRVYKKVKVAMPHCNVCEEQLRGNGSLMRPHNCSCGEWKTDWLKPGMGYKIKIKE
ncbi:MAG TPA: hypothetical protein ENI23_14005 [bacterium]|nr:hypothetical protein [bacterium]